MDKLKGSAQTQQIAASAEQYVGLSFFSLSDSALLRESRSCGSSRPGWKHLGVGFLLFSFALYGEERGFECLAARKVYAH